MPRGKRSADFTQISISIPKKLVEDIDLEATESNRSRSNFIVTELTAVIAMRRKMRTVKNPFKAAGETSIAPADGSFTPSTRLSAGAARDRETAARVNETEPAPRSGPRPRSTRGIKKTVASSPPKP